MSQLQPSEVISTMNNPRNLALAAVGVGAVLYFAPINFFRTPAVKAVEDRYSAGGGTDRHMPGTSTPRGEIESEQSIEIEC